jgi:hypothetical protein
MILTSIFILSVIACIGVLIYSKIYNEQYMSLGDIDSELAYKDDSYLSRKYLRELARRGLKWGPGSDYDKYRQRRAIGQIRTDGGDN